MSASRLIEPPEAASPISASAVLCEQFFAFQKSKAAVVGCPWEMQLFLAVHNPPAV
jgi:hypothetical protein